MKWYRLMSNDGWISVIRTEHGKVVEVQGPWKSALEGKTLKDIEALARERGFELNECGED